MNRLDSNVATLLATLVLFSAPLQLAGQGGDASGIADRLSQAFSTGYPPLPFLGPLEPGEFLVEEKDGDFRVTLAPPPPGEGAGFSSPVAFSIEAETEGIFRLYDIEITEKIGFPNEQTLTVRQIEFDGLWSELTGGYQSFGLNVEGLVWQYGDRKLEVRNLRGSFAENPADDLIQGDVHFEISGLTYGNFRLEAVTSKWSGRNQDGGFWQSIGLGQNAAFRILDNDESAFDQAWLAFASAFGEAMVNQDWKLAGRNLAWESSEKDKITLDEIEGENQGLAAFEAPANNPITSRLDLRGLRYEGEVNRLGVEEIHFEHSHQPDDHNLIRALYSTILPALWETGTSNEANDPAADLRDFASSLWFNGRGNWEVSLNGLEVSGKVEAELAKASAMLSHITENSSHLRLGLGGRAEGFAFDPETIESLGIEQQAFAKALLFESIGGNLEMSTVNITSFLEDLSQTPLETRHFSGSGYAWFEILDNHARSFAQSLLAARPEMKLSQLYYDASLLNLRGEGSLKLAPEETAFVLGDLALSINDFQPLSNLARELASSGKGTRLSGPMIFAVSLLQQMGEEREERLHYALNFQPGGNILVNDRRLPF